MFKLELQRTYIIMTVSKIQQSKVEQDRIVFNNICVFQCFLFHQQSVLGYERIANEEIEFGYVLWLTTLKHCSIYKLVLVKDNAS